MPRTIWLVALLGCIPCLAAQPAALVVRVEVTRDTWVSSTSREQNANNGGSTRLKTKGTQEFAIIDIDPKPLTGRVITSATLHLCAASKDIQRRVTVSTLASDWTEGTATSYQVQEGSASFRWARQNQQPWAWPGSDITAVCNGLGNTIWRFADATAPDANGWQSIAVDPDVLAARVGGISWGMVVFDDVGSEYERDGEQFTYKPFLNRFVYSREQGKNRAPYLTVQLGAEDREAPEAVGGIHAENVALPAGEAIVSWTTPNDRGPAGVIGFVARWAEEEAVTWEQAKPVPQYLVPLAKAAGGKVSMRLRDLGLKSGATITLLVRAADRAGNLSPPAKVQIKLSSSSKLDLKPAPAKPFTDLADLPTVGCLQVAIVDALDKINPVRGTVMPDHPASYLQANHLWSAAKQTVRLHAAKNEFVDFQVVLFGCYDMVSADLRFDDSSIKPQLFRFRHVATKLGPLPDPLVPQLGSFSIPAEDEQIPGQKAASLIADVYVPHDAKPGPHTGTLTIKAGADTLALRVELTIWNFTLPDHLSFIPEMNCYGLPRESELAYYRLAHAHRTCLNRLGYSWRGTISDNCAPKWNGKDFAWDDYDRRFGPLLDGSAFADLPRKGVPVEAFYLPLNENWPIGIDEGFTGGYWADSALTPAYRKAFVEACAKFAAHLDQKRWHQTFFEFYLNNKVYYKDKSWSRCSAPWILDEPSNTQDFWALRWYGVAFHEGVTPHRGQAKLAYRCDISRPQWQRNLLDGVLDVNIVGGAIRPYERAVMDRKTQHGEITFNYGSSNPVEASNVQPAAWCLDTWCLGGDGVLPWQTVGTDKSWQEGDPLCLFYPGKAIESREPVPSVRLKAYRRGQQDVEYLTVLSAVSNQPRFAIAAAVRDALKLSATFKQTSAEDAGTIDYGQVDPVALWDLRLRVGSMLDAAQPPAKTKWMDLRNPARNVSDLPDIGYITAGPR